MRFCQRLKQTIRLMPIPRWCSYSFVTSLCTKSNANFFKQEIVCVTIGTITRIVMENHSWCYPACIQCHKKTDINTAPFTCACGKYNERAVLRSLEPFLNLCALHLHLILTLLYILPGIDLRWWSTTRRKAQNFYSGTMNVLTWLGNQLMKFIG